MAIVLPSYPGIIYQIMRPLFFDLSVPYSSSKDKKLFIDIY